MDFLWRSLVIGIGGTAAMDLWALVLTAVFGVPLPNWGLVGRWFAHLSKGTFFHADITAAQAISNETSLGWVAHYAIGIIYAGALIFFAGPHGFQIQPFFPHGLWAWQLLVPAGSYSNPAWAQAGPRHCAPIPCRYGRSTSSPTPFLPRAFTGLHASHREHDGRYRGSG